MTVVVKAFTNTTGLKGKQSVFEADEPLLHIPTGLTRLMELQKV